MKLIIRILVALLIPLALLFLIVAGLISDAQQMRDDTTPRISSPDEPTVYIPTLAKGIEAPSLMEVFADNNGLNDEDEARLENIYSQYVSAGEMTDEERLKSFAGVLDNLADMIQEDSLKNHGFVGDSEGREMEFLRAMADKMK